MSLADQITKANAEYVAAQDVMTELKNALSEAEGEDIDAAQVAFDEAVKNSERIEKKLQSLRALEEKSKSNAKPVAAAAVVSQVKRDGKGNGDLLFKMAAANFIAYAQRKDVSQVIEERYKGHADLAAAHDYVAKSVVNPAMTSTVGWAQELVQSDTQGFLDTLRTVSVAAELASRSQRLSFGGYDSITIPMRNPLGATLTEPAWVN